MPKAMLNIDYDSCMDNLLFPESRAVPPAPILQPAWTRWGIRNINSTPPGAPYQPIAWTRWAERRLNRLASLPPVGTEGPAWAEWAWNILRLYA